MVDNNLLPVKVGAPVNGKQIYEVKIEEQNKKYVYTVPEENIDKFEKLNKESAELANYLAGPEMQEKFQKDWLKYVKKYKDITIAGTITGAVIPAAIAIFSKGSKLKRSIWGVLSSIVGAGVGACGSLYFGVKREIKNIIKSDKNLQELASNTDSIKKLGVKCEVVDITE